MCIYLSIYLTEMVSLTLSSGLWVCSFLRFLSLSLSFYVRGAFNKYPNFFLYTHLKLL